MLYIVGKNFAYVWIIKLNKAELDIERSFLLKVRQENSFIK
jgi:hypothetical protein